MGDLHTYRFAVGTFDAWPQLCRGWEDLQQRGVMLDSFNCLALQSAFAGKLIATPSTEPVGVRPLTFPGNRGAIGCSSGPLADCLDDRLRAGAPSLADALSLWLLPRHASHFERLVDAGRLLLWVLLADAKDERHAYKSLLATSSNSVGVHDLTAPTTERGHPRSTDTPLL